MYGRTARIIYSEISTMADAWEVAQRIRDHLNEAGMLAHDELADLRPPPGA